MRVLPFLFLIVLTACDPVVGVSRTASITEEVTSSCVMAALLETEDVKDLEHVFVEPKQSFSCSDGCKEKVPFDSYSFRARETKGSIQIFNQPNHARKIIFSSWKVERQMSSEEIEYRRALLDRIYTNMRMKCPGLPSASEVKETVTGRSR